MTKQTDTNARFTLWLDAELHEQFMRMCSRRGVTASRVLRNAVRLFVRGNPLLGDIPPLVVPPLSVRETVPELDDEASTFD